MKRHLTIGITFTLLLAGLLTAASTIASTRAAATIYIHADGRVDGTDTITSPDNVTYTLTTNLTDAIVVERNHIILNGAGYTLHGAGSGWGVSLTTRVNVTVRDLRIENFSYGIRLMDSTRTALSGNTVTATTDYGIYLHGASTHNTLSDNTITANLGDGFWLASTCHHNRISNNTITANTRKGIALSGLANLTITGNTLAHNGNGMRIDGATNVTLTGNTITASTEKGLSLYSAAHLTIANNTITANGQDGIHLVLASTNNTITGNTIADNQGAGIQLYPTATHNHIIGNTLTNNTYGIYTYNASHNLIHHNNFTHNTPRQAYDYPYTPTPSTNTWDNGYPSGGNYWSDYTGTDANSDGIGDTPYVIDDLNQDRYPIIPELPTNFILPLAAALTTLTLLLTKKPQRHTAPA